MAKICNRTVNTINIEKLIEKLNEKQVIKDKVIKRQDNLKVDHEAIVKDTEGKNILKGFFGKTVQDRKESASFLSTLSENVKTKLSRLIDPKVNNDLNKLFTKEQLDEMSSEELAGLSIAVTHIIDGIDTETALYNKYDLSPDTIDKLKIDGQTTTDLKRLYPVIGRSILRSQGKLLIGDGRTTLDNYTSMGKAAVQRLQEAGIINVAEDMDAIKGNQMVNEDGSLVDKTSTYNLNPSDKNKIYKSDVVYLNKDKFKGGIENSIQVSLKQMARLTMPYLEKLPVVEDGNTSMDMGISPDLVIEGVESKKVKKEIKDLIGKVQSGEFAINEEAVKFIRELSSIWKDNPGNKSIAKLFKQKLGKDSEFFYDILGIDLEKEYELSIYQESAFGQELSKVAPLIGLLQNADKLTDKETAIQFSMFLARNNRSHVYNDVLNYQTDKFMSRSILEAKEPTVYDTKEDIAEFIQRLAEMSNIDVETILNPSNNSGLDKALRVMKEKDATSIDIIESVHVYLREAGYDGKFWEGMKILKAIESVQNGKRNKDGELTSISSPILFEVDATASGVLIKFLQNITSNKDSKIYKLMEAMIKGDIKDSYAIGVEALENKIKLGKAKAGNDSLVVANISFTSKTEDLLSRIGGIENTKAVRELLKYAIMTFSYGQTAENNAKEFAKTVVDDLLKKGTTIDDVITFDLYKEDKVLQEFISKLRGNSDTVQLKDLNASQQRAFRRVVIQAVADKVGAPIVDDILHGVYGKDYFGDYDSQVKKLYEELTKAAKGDTSKIKVRSPLNVVFGEELDANVQLKLTKLKETLVDLKNEDGTSIIKQEHENVISGKVVPIHAMDSAILLQTLKDFYEARGENFNPKSDSLMMIHDAIQANSKIAKEVSDLYEKNLIKVSHKYDVRTELVRAIEAANGTIDEKLKNEVEASVKDKRKGMEELFNLDKDSSPSTVLKNSFTTDFSGVGEVISTKQASTNIIRNTFKNGSTEAPTTLESATRFEDQIRIIEEMNNCKTKGQ